MRCVVLALTIAFALLVRNSLGQDTNLLPTGGEVPGQTLGVESGVTGSNTGDFSNQGTNGSTGTGGTSGSDGQVEPVQLDLGSDLEDTRNQGFVGATADRVQELGFVGASSENSGPPLVDGASFGGGVNNSSTQAGGGGGNSQFGGGFGNGFSAGFGGNQFGVTGTQNGFQIIRSNLRTNMVARFNAPVVSSEQTVVRFQERILRQPIFHSAGKSISNSVSVRIIDRTAVLTGYASSPAERERWERQLRLEPGVDRIINRIEIPAQ